MEVHYLKPLCHGTLVGFQWRKEGKEPAGAMRILPKRVKGRAEWNIADRGVV